MTTKLSFASQAMRLLAAASLACTVTAIGCSTDRTPGSGEPERYAPSVSPTMPSSTPGSEQNRPINPPMISSYTAPNAVLLRQRSNLDALAIAAADQSYRGRYLGPADPGGTPSYAANPQSADFMTGQFINPSDTANPEITVNRSISSPPNEVITGGGGGFAVSTVTVPAGTSGAITSGVTLTPTTAAVTNLSPTAAANTVSTAANTVAANANTANAAAPVFANRVDLITPTMSSAVTPSPTAAANPPVGSVRRTTATTGTTSMITANNNVRTSMLTTATASSASPLVITRSANGIVTISNVDRAVTTGSQPLIASPPMLSHKQ